MLKEYHVILKKIMNQVQTRAALQMQAAAQMGATMVGGYRPPAPGSMPPMQQPQQQPQQFQRQVQQHGALGMGLQAASSTAAAASMGTGTTPTDPYPMQSQGFPMPVAGAGYPAGTHAAGPPPSGAHVAGGTVGGMAAVPVQPPMLQPPDDMPMVTFKEEPASSGAAG